MSSWWLYSGRGKYRNTKTGREKFGKDFARKDGFVARNVRRNIIRKEEVRQNQNGSTVKSYRGIDSGSVQRPTKAIKNLSRRTRGSVAANIRMLFQRSDGTYIWVSTGYVSLDRGSLSAAITGLITKYGMSPPSYFDLDILGWD